MNPLIQNYSRENTSNYWVDDYSWEFWYLCKRFPNFYIKWIQIYRKTGLQEGYLPIPQYVQYVSIANLLSKFQNAFKNFIFLWFVTWKGNGR